MGRQTTRQSTITSLPAQLFGLDLRSLAAFRITAACVVLFDLAQRVRDLSDHYTDLGMLSRSAVLEAFGFLHDWPLCVHLMTGSWWGQAILFSLHALVALAMLVGYRTRSATFLTWVFTASLQLRNLYIGHGGDAYIRMLLFWGIFLPLGARASVDAYRRRAQPKEEHESSQHFSVGSVALILQIVILYMASGYAKALIPEWANGTALAQGLDNEFWGTYTGSFLLQFPVLCSIFTYVVMVFEIVGPLLLFVPFAFGPFRVALLGAFALMHVAFEMGLRIGIFSLTSLAALPALLPGWFWDRLARTSFGGSVVEGISHRMEGMQARGWFGTHTGAIHTILPASPWPFRLREATCGLFLAYIVMWNIGVISDRTYTAPGPIAWFGSTAFVQQDWRMFAAPVTLTGWITIPGLLRDGTAVDLARGGGPLPSIEDASSDPESGKLRPQKIIYRTRNDRWLHLLDRIIHRTRGNDPILQYGRFLCRTWNSRYSGERQLDTFEIVFMSRKTEPWARPHTTADYTRDVVWTHGCFR